MNEGEEEKKDERYSYIEVKTAYSNNVLTGDWFQSRLSTMPQSNTAIVPCVLEAHVTQKGCEQHATTNQAEYTPKFIEDDLTRKYAERKSGKFANFMRQRATCKFVDHEKYMKNAMTMNHLLYDMWPKLVKQTQELEAKNSTEHKHPYSSRPDPLQPYGNRSTYNRRVCKEPPCPIPTSYLNHFKARPGRPAQSIRRPNNIDRLT